MKIVLIAINAKYIHSNLAVYNLEAYANNKLGLRDDISKKQNLDNIDIQILEFTINNYEDYILESIYKSKPDIIAFSCYIWNIEYVTGLVGNLRKLLPDIPIWAGGPEVSYDCESFLKINKDIDGVMYGEGEETFLELVKYYNDRKCGVPIEASSELLNIKGIAFRKNGEIMVNEPRKPIKLDDIPFCYSDLDKFKNKIIYYESSRGCPFSCSYCLSSIDKSVRFRSLELVRRELKSFIDEGIPQVKFVDRTFNCNREHAGKIWQFILENDNGVTNFHFEIGADLLNEEDLELMSKMRPGLIQLEIGVQSTNERTIQEINRKMDFERLSETVKRINSFGNIHQHLDLIAGLPYEGYESFKQSFNDVYALKPEQLQLGFLKVLKGSNMHLRAKDYCIEYRERPVYEVLYTKWLSYIELLVLKRIEEMVEIYYNSGQFANTLKWLLDSFDTPFDMYRLLGDFYESKGYSKMSQSRMTRYDILLEFVREQCSVDISVLKQLMLYDLYLRENLKSRPSWSDSLEADNSKYKETVREIYIKEESERKLLKGYEQYGFKQLMKMTHIELFDKEVFGGTELKNGQFCNGRGDKVFVLFDYMHRNPLNHEAKTIKLYL